jgi:[ribosomal protein S5]-alanine N-acetyltransferase
VTVPLETPRLYLRPIAMEDAEQIQSVFPQWEIVQYLNAIVPWPYPSDGARTWISEHALPAVARGDEWHWTLRRKAAPREIIGAIGLVRSGSENRGFWIAPEWRNQGLMTEAVIVVTDYWFDVPGLPALRAPKAVANVASRRISEKTGMRLIGTEQRPLVSGLQTSEIWEITAEEWRAFRKERRDG